MIPLPLFKKTFLTVTLFCSSSASAMSEETTPYQIPDNSASLAFLHLKAFQTLQKQPRTTSPSKVFLMIDKLKKMRPQGLQALAQKSYTESLSSARCYTATECCLLAGTIACVAYEFPLITSAPTYSEAALPLATTACAVCCGGCHALCNGLEAHDNYRDARDWKLFLFPSAVNMPPRHKSNASSVPDASSTNE